MNTSSITEVEGRGIPITGNDIDTDRIIPARYLRQITFDGLGEFAFEDDRKSTTGHPFDDDRFQGASVLVGNANFGCGSSREHAPQALMRWGIRAIVGESFAEIFQGNCTAIGLPCVAASPDHVQILQRSLRDNPRQPMKVDLRNRTVSLGDQKFPLRLPDSNRLQLIEGAWDANTMLLEGADVARKVSQRLPYIAGF